MGTRKSGEQEVRNITQNSSGSYQISIPKHLVGELSWRQGQKVIVTKLGNKLIVEDWNDSK